MVGNGIFELKDFLIPSYPGTRSGKLPIDIAIFNYRLSRARRVIENSFGFLVDWWRLFRKPIRPEKQNTANYILTVFTLHSYLQ